MKNDKILLIVLFFRLVDAHFLRRGYLGVTSALTGGKGLIVAGLCQAGTFSGGHFDVPLLPFGLRLIVEFYLTIDEFVIKTLFRSFANFV